MATLQVSITSDADDGYDDGSSWKSHIDNYSNSDKFRVQDNPTTLYEGGVRFQNVTIAQGATINSAVITLTVSSGLAGFDSMTAYGDDVDDAAAWSNSSRPQSGFTNTSAGVTNSSLPASGTFTLDVTACAQDIVDRGGWVSGNAMRFRLTPSDTYATGTIYDYDAGHSSEAYIDFDYTVAGSANPKGIFGMPLNRPLRGPL